MNGRLPRRSVERYGDHAGASELHVAHAPCGRYGGLAYRGGRYGELTAALPPVVHGRYGELAPPCERLAHQ